MRFLLVSTVSMALALSAPALAQEQVNLRTGEHRGYTRLVFDWPQNVTYEMKEDASGAFTITFGKAGKVNPAVKGKNVEGVSVVSENPLTLSVKVPSGAKSRTFPVNNRIVVDVYDPPAVPEKKAEAQPAKPVENKPAESKPVDNKAAENKAGETKPDDTKPEAQAAAATPVPDPNSSPTPPAAAQGAIKSAKVEDVTDNAVAPPDEKVLKEVQDALKSVENIVAEVINPDRPRPPESQPVQEGDSSKAPDTQMSTATPPAQQGGAAAQAAKDKTESAPRANQFTLSATAAVGLAVFEDFGKLWMVTNRSDIIVSPQASGPDAAKIQPVAAAPFDGGLAYVAPVLPGLNTRSEGGGLLWSIHMTPEKPEKTEKKPTPLIRSDIDKKKLRSGKITFPFKTARSVLDVPDPVTGGVLKVVPVDDAGDFAGEARSFVDFDILKSPLGIAIRPKVDDLSIVASKDGVVISRPEGLSILPEEMISGIEKSDFNARMAKPGDERRIFNFKDWKMGGLAALNENRNVILSGMGNMSKASQIENLITLAKMQLANGRGAEALGFLEFAATEMPELAQNPEFLSLRGVAKAFDWKTDEAFQELSSPILEDYDEIDIWRAFTLADLGDWQQARDVLPDNISPVRDYPSEIKNRLGIVLAEIYLRSGDLELAKALLSLIETDKDKLNLAHDAALQYLKGEAARQDGNLDETKKSWTALANGSDDLYRVKAGLALARLQLENKEITPKQAIDALERLRYAWRGDELEAQVNYWLGRTYFESGQYVKGMGIMRDAAKLVPDSVLGERIKGDMASLFTDFYTGDGLAKVSPMDAVALYEDFRDLVPRGQPGNTVISNLAEHLVDADLLDRAADLLNYQITNRLSGDEAAKAATRLAAIQMIDKNGEGALQSLKKADELLKKLPAEAQTQARSDELELLRARALSQSGKTAEALKILEGLTPSKRVNRLRADIAWQSAFWDDAAYALEDVILDENISLTRPLLDEHAMLILQRAVAQNLSGDRIGLANTREKYAEAMSQTPKAKLFDVVTRARQNAGLADRETLLSTVSEVDLFEEFLNTYKDVNPSDKSN